MISWGCSTPQINLSVRLVRKEARRAEVGQRADQGVLHLEENSAEEWAGQERAEEEAFDVVWFV